MFTLSLLWRKNHSPNIYIYWGKCWFLRSLWEICRTRQQQNWFLWINPVSAVGAAPGCALRGLKPKPACGSFCGPLGCVNGISHLLPGCDKCEELLLRTLPWLWEPWLWFHWELEPGRGLSWDSWEVQWKSGIKLIFLVICPCVINLLQLCFVVSVISLKCCHLEYLEFHVCGLNACEGFDFLGGVWQGKDEGAAVPQLPSSSLELSVQPRASVSGNSQTGILACCPWCLGAPRWGGKPRDCGLTYLWNILDIRAVITTTMRAWWVIKLISELQVSCASHFNTSCKTVAVKLCSWVHGILES